MDPGVGYQDQNDILQDLVGELNINVYQGDAFNIEGHPQVQHF
jgi:hypothetical protein